LDKLIKEKEARLKELEDQIGKASANNEEE